MEKYPKSILPTFPSKILNNNALSKREFLSKFIVDAQLLLDILQINAYAENIKLTEFVKNNINQNNIDTNLVSEDIRSNKSGILYATLQMQAPINLWSSQVLQLRNDQPINNFEIKLLDAYARKCGLEFTLLSTIFTKDINVQHVVRFS